MIVTHIKLEKDIQLSKKQIKSWTSVITRNLYLHFILAPLWYKAAVFLPPGLLLENPLILLQQGPTVQPPQHRVSFFQ